MIITKKNPYSEGSIEAEATNYEKIFCEWLDTNFSPMLEVKTLEF